MFDVLHWYEFYLIIVFLITLRLRFAFFRDLFALGSKLPKRWPNMLKTILKERWIFINLQAMLPVGVALSTALAHSFFRRFWWSEAKLSFSLLRYSPLWSLVLFSLSAFMVWLDCRVLVRRTHLEIADLEKRFDRGELALSRPIDLTVRVVTFGVIRPRQIVEDQVAEALKEQALCIETQMRGWMGRSLVRIAFGITCWFAWAYLSAMAA